MKNVLIGILTILVLVLGFTTFSDSQILTTAEKVEVEQTKFNATTTSSLGLVSIKRDQSFASTTLAIREAIENNEKLTLMTEVDHQANAEGADLQLAPTTLFVFGNPSAGTPLMQASASTAIDLPQKLLVAERNGEVTVYYNAPSYLADRHTIKDQSQRLETIADLLENIARVNQQ